MTQGEMAITQAVMGTAGGSAGMFTDPKVTNPPFSSHTTHVVPTDSHIQRGYIRLLGQVLRSNLGVVDSGFKGDEALQALSQLGAKLDFQFNPNQLVRSVTARTDTQLWINQSPSELLTPGLGDMSFAWQMLFNREEEVQRYANAKGRWDSSSMWGNHSEGGNSQSLDALLNNNPSEPMVAERIGVLADIMVLDQITGQRLTEAAVKFSEKWALTKDEDGNVSPEEPISVERRDSLLDANLTNSAFLIPNPIRVLFSENFMVDGYVNTVSVSLQKFSPDMVPTVCVVDISMHALYQGFARRSTVFTTLAGIETDEGGTAGSGMWEDEAANAEATVVGSTEYTLQTAGLTGAPAFAGFDHSPSKTSKFSDEGNTKMNEWKVSGGIDYTASLPARGDDEKQAPRGGASLKIQNRDTGSTAISFGIVSNLNDSSLGSFIRNNGGADNAKEWFTNILPSLQVQGYVGLQLRARLKATSQASLNLLWQDGVPNEAGFENYRKAVQSYNATTEEWEAFTTPDDHFFDSWSTEQRRLLFAAGIDTFQHDFSAAGNTNVRNEAARQTENQATGWFTRSFPIMEVGGDGGEGYYGDDFYKHQFTYGSENINFDIGDDPDEGWIWSNSAADPEEILAEEWKCDLAKGFYDASGVPFPDELVLTGIGSTADETYTIQYQQNLTLRVRVSVQDTDSAASKSNGWLPISDTGILIIAPRQEGTGIIEDVDTGGITKWGVTSGQDLKGDLRGYDDGSDGITAVMEDGKWMEAHGGAAQGIGSDCFYDGLYKHPGNNGFEDNMKQYGAAYDRTNPDHPSLGGLMISSTGLRIGATPAEFKE